MGTSYGSYDDLKSTLSKAFSLGINSEGLSEEIESMAGASSEEIEALVKDKIAANQTNMAEAVASAIYEFVTGLESGYAFSDEMLETSDSTATGSSDDMSITLDQERDDSGADDSSDPDYSIDADVSVASM